MSIDCCAHGVEWTSPCDACTAANIASEKRILSAEEERIRMFESKMPEVQETQVAPGPLTAREFLESCSTEQRQEFEELLRGGVQHRFPKSFGSCKGTEKAYSDSRE